MWQAQVFTLYPEIFPGPLSKGLYGKALSKKLWNLNIVNIRDVAEDKHKTVDDTPYGGGSGMLLKPDVLAKSLDYFFSSLGASSFLASSFLASAAGAASTLGASSFLASSDPSFFLSFFGTAF